MGGAKMKVAELDKGRLAKVRALEKDLGCCVVALEPEARPAALSPAQVRRVQAVEKDLGVLLVAYKLT